MTGKVRLGLRTCSCLKEIADSKSEKREKQIKE